MSMASATTRPGSELTLTRSIPAMAETAVVILLFLLFSEALLGPLLTDESDPEGSPILRMMWLPVYAVILILGLTRLPALFGLGMRMPMMIALMLLIVASVVWSIDQELTLRRSIAISMTSVFGVYLAARYSWQDLLALLGFAWLILTIGSIVVSLGVPSLGVEQGAEHAGAWRGLWFQKNAMGGNMSRTAFLFAFLAITQPNLRKLWSVATIMAVALVLLSTSKTSLLGMLIGALVLGCGAIMRRGPVSTLTLVWGGLTLAALIGILVSTQPALVLELIGRDATLTGRTDIWAALSDMIRERPRLGFGYGAFWGEESLPAAFVREVTQWDVPTAHNGWLETWLSIGVVGLSLFAISFLATLWRALALAVTSWRGFFAIGSMLQFFLFSISESIILQQNSITWLTYVVVAAALVQEGRPARERAGLPFRRRRDFLLVEQ